MKKTLFPFSCACIYEAEYSWRWWCYAQSKVMISCCWFSGFSVVGANWSDKIQFIQPIISYIKLLNILKLPFHEDDDDDDDNDTLVNCMEALLVSCSWAGDIDHFLKKIWWQVLQDIDTGWCLWRITMMTMCCIYDNLLYLYFNYLFIVFQIYCFIKFTIHSCGNSLCFYNAFCAVYS